MNNIRLEIFSKNKQSLQKFLKFLFSLKNNLIISYKPKRKLRQIITVLKSPHVNKSAQEQFEYRIYSKTVFINTLQVFKFLLLLKKIKNTNFPFINFKMTLKSNFFSADHKKLFLYLNPNNLNINFYENFNDIQKFSKKTDKYLKILDTYGELLSTK
jgi:ribosomal protein S10